MESRSASPNAVRELEEALWLAQEELAEEQSTLQPPCRNCLLRISAFSLLSCGLGLVRPCNSFLFCTELFSGLRAEERKHYAIFHDEVSLGMYVTQYAVKINKEALLRSSTDSLACDMQYLRLQEESIINSRRTTAAEVCCSPLSIVTNVAK